MKKILFVIPSLSGGGAERFVSILSNYLSSKEYSVRILMFEDKTPFYHLNDNIVVKRVGYKVDRSNRLKSIFQIVWNVIHKSVASVKKEILEYKPDVIIPFLPQADVAVYLASSRKRKYKIICSERNDPTERSKSMKILLKKIYSNVDWLVCQSEQVVAFYDCIEKHKKVVIANPVDPQNIPAFCEKESDFRIVAAGRLDFQKNFSMLINSFADCVEKLPIGTTLTIYGEGREREQLCELVDSRNITDKVFLPGLNKNLLYEIRDAALFVMSSDFEGFPNALLEAMVIGLPVISTDFATGTARTLIGPENGAIVPIKDRIGLSNAIVDLMNDSEKRNRMRKNNRKLLNKYSIDAIVSQWEKLINS